MIFPRREGSSTLPRQFLPSTTTTFSSTLPRKIGNKEANKVLSDIERNSSAEFPILAFSNARSGRCSAPLPAADIFKQSEMSTTVHINKPALLPRSIRSESRLFTMRSVQNVGNSLHRMTTEPSKSIVHFNESSDISPEADVFCDEEKFEEVDYNFAQSIVTADKMIQGLPPPDHETHLYQVTLSRDVNGSLGFSLSLDQDTRYLVVKTIRPGSVAEKCGEICIGDRLVQIGDYDLAGKDYEDCVSLLRSLFFPVKLTFERRPDGLTTSESEHFDDGTGEGENVDDDDERFDTLQPQRQTNVEEKIEAKYMDGFFGEMNASGVPLGTGNENVVHEEVTYPVCSELPRRITTDPAYVDDENPYARPGEDVDEELIEKMLDALGDNFDDDEFELANDPGSIYQIELQKFGSDFGFTFDFTPDGGCLVQQVEPEQHEMSGLSVGDEIAAVNNIPIKKINRIDFNEIMKRENTLHLSLLASSIPQPTIKQSLNHYTNSPVCYDFQLPNDISHQANATTMITVKVQKQPSEELGCSLFASGSELFIGTVKTGSKLEACGVQSGDMVLLINEESVFGMPSEKVAQALRSAAGDISLTLSRRQNPELVKSNNSALTLDHNIVGQFSRQLSQAVRADLRRLLSIWSHLDTTDFNVEFAAISENQSCDVSSDAFIDFKHGIQFAMNPMPEKRSINSFWQMLCENPAYSSIVLLGELPHGVALPNQADETIRIAGSNLTIRVVASSAPSTNVTALTCLAGERPVHIIHYQSNLLHTPGLVEALLLVSEQHGHQLMVCGALSRNGNGDWRGLFCAAASLLSQLLAAPAGQRCILTAASVRNTAADICRQFPASMRRSDDLASLYDAMQQSIERLLTDDAFVY